MNVNVSGIGTSIDDVNGDVVSWRRWWVEMEEMRPTWLEGATEFSSRHPRLYPASFLIKNKKRHPKIGWI